MYSQRLLYLSNFEISGAEGITDHITFLRLFFFISDESDSPVRKETLGSDRLNVPAISLRQSHERMESFDYKEVE